MYDEQIYLYYYKKQTGDADRIDITIDNLGFNVERVMLDDDNQIEDEILNLVDKDRKTFPLLRVGSEKIKVTLFNPTDRLLKSIFSDDDEPKTALPKPTVYCSTWSGDCHTLKDWLTDHCLNYKDICIDEKDNLAEKIIRWSGGRRVVPTIEFKGVGRLFNPGLDLIKRIL